jgi:hypothetical protein
VTDVRVQFVIDHTECLRSLVTFFFRPFVMEIGEGSGFLALFGAHGALSLLALFAGNPHLSTSAAPLGANSAAASEWAECDELAFSACYHARASLAEKVVDGSVYTRACIGRIPSRSGDYCDNLMTAAECARALAEMKSDAGDTLGTRFARSRDSGSIPVRRGCSCSSTFGWCRR